ncbi:hypothetical protein ACH6CV_16800 [Bacillota bacterium Meth-B3]
MRVIDADALKHAVSNIDMHGRSEQFYEIMGEIAEVLSSAPTIEAEPVVRRKECTAIRRSYDGSGRVCSKTNSYRREDDFCSYGERKETDHA